MPENPVTHRPMASLTEVFGGAKNTPREVFNRSRNEYAGSTANHRANDLAMECPMCKARGTPNVRLFAKDGVGYYCVAGGHKWKDYDELMSLNPKKLEFKGIQARQEGWEKFTLEVPGSVLKDLQLKYGDKLAATLRGMFDVMIQPRFLVLPEEDIKRLTEHTGAELRNSSQLVGAVYSLKQTNTELVEQHRLLKQNRSPRQISPTAVVVELGSCAAELMQKAEDWGQEPGELIANKVRELLENKWF